MMLRRTVRFEEKVSIYRRTSVDDGTDGGTVALAVSGDTEKVTKGRHSMRRKRY